MLAACRCSSGRTATQRCWLHACCAQDEANQYCGREIILGPKQVVSLAGADWFKVSLPLTMWACDKGSAGSLASINRVDFQNILLRDADVCIDDIVLTT